MPDLSGAILGPPGVEVGNGFTHRTSLGFGKFANCFSQAGRAVVIERGIPQLASIQRGHMILDAAEALLNFFNDRIERLSKFRTEGWRYQLNGVAKMLRPNAKLMECGDVR